MAKRKQRKTYEDIKECILQLTPLEIKLDTKYIIYFEDHGQDFLEWHINKEGYVLDSKPLQRNIWAGKFTIPETAEIGGKLAIWLDGESYVTYPIKDIKIIRDSQRHKQTESKK